MFIIITKSLKYGVNFFTCCAEAVVEFCAAGLGRSSAIRRVLHSQRLRPGCQSGSYEYLSVYGRGYKAGETLDWLAIRLSKVSNSRGESISREILFMHEMMRAL